MNKVLFLILVFFSASSVSSNSYYNYRNIEKPEIHFTIDLVNKDFVYIDIAEDAVICGEKSNYNCFKHEAISFHFPKKLSDLQEGEHWAVDKHIYRIGKVVNSFSWKEEVTYFIEKEENDTEYSYVFSSLRGLLAYRVSEDEKTNTYILNGVCGYLSEHNCLNQLSSDN